MLVSKNLALAFLFAGGSGGSGSGSVAHAFPANASTYINVHIPNTLHKTAANSTDGQSCGYPHKRGTIGTAFSSHLPPSGSMSLNVYLASDDICAFPLDKTTGHPERPIDPATGKTAEWAHPFALLADRGNCTFATKARNAQMAGAAAVLFADTHCLCSDVHCVSEQGENDTVPCQTEEPAVGDDGSAGDVSIPTFLLQKPGAQDMKETLLKNTPVLVDIKWHPPQVTHSIDYAVWMDPLDNSTKALLKDFKPISEALGNKVTFTPRFMIHNGSLSHCVGNTGGEGEGDACKDMCTNHGRYCFPSASIPGSAVVTESLRRMCIWEKHGQDDHDGILGQPWWEYVEYFNGLCSDSNATFADEKCIDEAYAFAKVSVEDVKSCMTDSGDPTQDVENVHLDKAIEEQALNGVFLAPTIHINHQTLSWTAAVAAGKASPVVGMLETICGGYEEGHVPEVCARCLGAKDVVSCAASDDHHGGDDDDDDNNHGGDHRAAPKSHGFRNFMIFFVLAGAVGGSVFYMYKMRDSHSDSSFGALRYAMLGDNDNNGGGS